MELRELVIEAALHAGAVALSHFRTALSVERKPDLSPVTVADRATEAAARAFIEARFPDDGILGEELGEVRPGARRRWIVDPIDGTRSFVRGVPLWGTLVAVAEGQQVLAGCAVFPALAEWAAAEVGRGAVSSEGPCRVSGVREPGRAAVLCSDDRLPGASPARLARFRALGALAGESRTWGDAYGYYLVATGRAEAMIDAALEPWDAAAMLPIVTEAGGVFTDWSGRETAFGGSAIATNAALADAVRAALKDAP